MFGIWMHPQPSVETLSMEHAHVVELVDTLS
jgi:hypothetical protein